MKENFRAALKVNKKAMDMNPFVEEFFSRISLGMVSSLKGTEDVKSLEIHQKRGNVEITVNGKDIPLTPFPNGIISNTLVGMVSSLKDVDDIDSVDISVELG